MTVKEDPDVIVAVEVKLFGTVGRNFHRDLKVCSEVEIMAGFCRIIIFGKVDVVDREDAMASIGVGIRSAGNFFEGNFATVDTFRNLFAVFVGGFVEPAIEIIGRLDGVIADNVSSKNIMISGPSFRTIIIRWDGEAVAAERAFDNIGDDSLRVELALAPFKLTFRIVTIILALVPVGDRYGNRLRAA